MTSKVTRIKVWDSFIRLYHWLMVGLVAGLWWSADNGDMSLHFDLAKMLAALLLVRIGWGLFGSENIRFHYFLKSPKAVFTHLRALFKRRYQNSDTHSAAGGWAVAAMLLLLCLQFITGLFSSDGILFSGPLASYVSTDTSDWLTDWHKEQFNYLLALIGLHVFAIALYRVLGVPLLGAMFSGYRDTKASQPNLKPGWHAVLLVVAVWFILTVLLS
ncbi:cytochrome b/b6 domain-containing protein [Idiomarina seosinensis]|uniref:cytochrome b/b6 domain-containing protein n=1 Tax=Idiomarina seosinensis TaxID=281739 RepID=UPI00384DBC6A